MKTNYTLILLALLVLLITLVAAFNAEIKDPAVSDGGGSAMLGTPLEAGYSNNGETVPKPVFQVGDTPSEPFADESTEAQDFIEFFNNTYFKDEDGTTLPLLSKGDVVWFPPQMAGDTSLDTVARVTPGETANCDAPDGYPILCDADFSSGEFCKACHDSVLFVEGGGLPQMAYFSEPDFSEQHEVWLANWSQYGDWSSNIMRLATRDPIWQAQIETETNTHPYADPAVIQDVCFSCHGEMGERQLKFDHGPKQTYCTDLFYATIPGVLSDTHRGQPYPFTGDCEPIAGKPIEENQELYAKYGSLGRDGVSCETCHRIGPENGNGQWNGTDYQVFYGPTSDINVVERQPSENKVPVEYDFTATFSYDMHNIMTPDPLQTLDLLPMKADDNLNITYAYNQKDQVSYLGQSIICGTCHLLIVPQIPSVFQPGQPLPDSEVFEGKYPFYERPEACDESETLFAPATNGEFGNPVTDECVGLGYEQATYLEWINSSFASEEDNENTCQGCHMPLVTDPSDPTDHTAIMAQSTQDLTPKDYRRHRLMGINLPVFEMFMQFPDVLGVAPYDDLVPPSGGTTDPNGQEVDFIQNYLLNGQMAIIEQATSQANGNGLLPNTTISAPQASTEISVTATTVQVVKRVGEEIIAHKALRADVTVVNNTGHKFPSGAGFRRAFLKFEVLDSAGKVIWVSGQTNPYGAICDGFCQRNNDNTYNLIGGEVITDGDPKKLQPHYQLITNTSQVQIYAVQAVNDDGKLTSRTLSLFHDAKDNRLLPQGFMGPDELECDENPNAGTEIFGIKQCSAAYATGPQLEPLTVGSVISQDIHYTDSAFAGSDTITYQILSRDIQGTPSSVRVTMEYQTIPPAFLAARFSDGNDQGNFLPATERSIYLTSHLNTNLPLKSEHPDNPNLTFSNNWTTSIYQAEASLDQGPRDPRNPLNDPPDCSAAAASPDTIWPPNNKFVSINVVGVTDPDGDAVSITIDSIFQDEPVDTKSNFVPDGQGVGTDTAEVRAEREGSGNGRVYHIGFTADDGNDGTCSAEVVVGVPRNQNRDPIDDGALFDSTVVP